LNQADPIHQLHQTFKEQLKKEKRFVRFYQALIFVLFFSLWETASRLQWIDPLIFSSPTSIAELFIKKISDGTLIAHLSVTLTETVFGFILGTLLGTILASILWWSPFLSKVLDPYLVVMNAMPKVALGPIFIVTLGPGYLSIVTMGAIISVIITTIVVYTSFKETDSNYIKVMRTFRAKRTQIFRHVVLPASFPSIISTLKVNVGLSWVGVIVGEFLVSSKGLGYLVVYGFQVFDFTLVLMSLLIIAVFATIMYQLVAFLEKILIRNQ